MGRGGVNKQILLKEHGAELALWQVRGRRLEEGEVTAGWRGQKGLQGKQGSPGL